MVKCIKVAMTFAVPPTPDVFLVSLVDIDTTEFPIGLLHLVGVVADIVVASRELFCFGRAVKRIQWCRHCSTKGCIKDDSHVFKVTRRTSRVGTYRLGHVSVCVCVCGNDDDDNNSTW